MASLRKEFGMSRLTEGIDGRMIEAAKTLSAQGGTLEDLEVLKNPEANPRAVTVARAVLRELRGEVLAPIPLSPPQIVPGAKNFINFDLSAFMVSWTKFYGRIFQITLDPASVLLPPLELALGSGLIRHPDVTIEKVLSAWKKNTPKELLYRYTESDLDAAIQKEKESWRPSGTYVAWAYPAIEATDQAPELAEKSYEDIQAMPGVWVMNYPELPLYALWHYVETGVPLDQKTVSLSDSLDAAGRALGGSWHGDGFCVHWCHRRGSHPSIRARRIVLPQPKAA
ncbi:MAG: hypothetical protein AAB420_03660 [Patescibacteria group bacterium]